MPSVGKQDPELEGSQTANPTNGEKTDPLDTDGCSEGEARHGQPKPPGGGEGLGRALLMQVGEGKPGEDSHGSEDDEGRVKENKARLGDKAVFWKGGLDQHGDSGMGRRMVIPKMTRPAPNAAVMVLQPTVLRVRNMVGMVRIPQMAGSIRMAT